MSPRTYIGPFGRILPVSDDRELERQRLPEHALDETRTNKLNYQLPPPKRLEFGTDVSSGFTEPMRYNTISQSSRTQGSRHQLFSESPKLPSVHQILKPPSSSNAPTLTPHSPQRSPTPAQPPRGTFTSPRVPSSDQVVRASQYNNGTDCSQPQMTTQVQYQTTVSPPREDYQISPSTHHFPTTYGYQRSLHVSPYVSSFESNGLTAYSSQSHQIAPPIVRHQQQTNPSDAIHVQPMLPYSTGQTQHMQPVNGPSPYPHGQTSTYQAPITPMVTAETSQSAPSNPVKPQPRLVAERDIPGEGPSWVYEDGSTCKKVIDGETVNAQWGVTKAGKPRKRLAIACTTCREKKIKCDPAEPKCVQCEKFDRECKFMTA